MKRKITALECKSIKNLGGISPIRRCICSSEIPGRNPGFKGSRSTAFAEIWVWDRSVFCRCPKRESERTKTAGPLASRNGILSKRSGGPRFQHSRKRRKRPSRQTARAGKTKSIPETGFSRWRNTLPDPGRSSSKSNRPGGRAFCIDADLDKPARNVPGGCVSESASRSHGARRTASFKATRLMKEFPPDCRTCQPARPTFVRFHMLKFLRRSKPSSRAGRQ